MKVLNTGDLVSLAPEHQLPTNRTEHPGAGEPPLEGDAGVDRRLVEQALASGAAPEVWRSFGELAGTNEFQQLIDNEFPRYSPSEWDEGTSRRTFLQLAGASIGLAGLAGCTRQPPERIVPYVRQPEFLIPGRPLFYSTAMPLGGYGTGLLTESHMGRPTKVSGNSQHPASSGGTDVFAQASILGLYDPDRSQSIERRGKIFPWEKFIEELSPALSAYKAIGGDGVVVLTGATSSPTFGDLMQTVLAGMPKARWVQYEAINDDAAHDAAVLSFGRELDTRYELSKADVVVSLDSDFLTSGPGHLRYARDFASRRKHLVGENENEGGGMSRFYAFETLPTPTGTLADHRFPVNGDQLFAVASGLAQRLGVAAAESTVALETRFQAVIEALVSDLSAHRGRSAVVPGRFAPSSIHVLAQAINEALGNFGSTVVHTEPVLLGAEQRSADIAALVEHMSAGKVEALFILGANPVHDTPTALGFAEAMSHVGLTVHLGLHKDETAARCLWHLPQAHYLESWGDVRSFDGTLSAIQPLIEPIFGGHTDLEVLSVLAGRAAESYDLVRRSWQRRGMAEEAFRRALHDGFVEGSQASPVAASVRPGAIADIAAPEDQPAAGLEIFFRPDPSLYDGRFANNGWLQELPKPLTKLTWDAVATVGWNTAKELNLATGDVARIEVGGRAIELPAWVNPGQAEGTIGVPFGFGRRAAGRVGNEIGANVNEVRPTTGGYVASAKVSRTGSKYPLASTQEHFQMASVQAEQAEQRHLIRKATLEEYRKRPDFAHAIEHHIPEAPMFPDWKYEGHSWGMAIDLGSCTGCNACITSCQAENNIPVVGKDQVSRGREMLWLRIDRYYEGDPADPKIHHQPVACMHCERAPCELVCPVGATVHSDEGLNDMAYNRCIGTRYCSNNCPYKVRRFNFFKYQDTKTPILKLARNPNVSVRARGVMEKCTYCVQRINIARADSKREGRKINDGEIRTACQEACPTQAISFGDLNDPQAEVVKWKSSHLNYGLLPELAVQPRTTYLAKITNPHPSLVKQGAGGFEPGAEQHGTEQSH